MLLAGGAVKAQQTILAPWNHTWAVMHPMGAMPDGPAGPDPDFDTTWYLPAAEFGLQYNGPLFGGAQSGTVATANSYDSRLTEGPVGYDVIGYFTAAGAEFTSFGDNDGNTANGRAGSLTTPASGQRRAAYLRSTFTVPSGGGMLINPRIRYLIDDGAYLYLDGELVAAINMAATTPANLDSYAATPEIVAPATGNEGALLTLDLSLPAGATSGTARIVKQTLSLTEGGHTLALSVRNNALTSSDMVIALELSADNGCTLAATTETVTRSDAGTPYVPGDDTFSFRATVTGVNAGTTWTSDDAAVTSGAYDTPTTFGPYPVTASPKVITFTSASLPPCTTQVSVTPPGGTLQAAVQAFSRHQQGTVDPADDTFTSSVLVSGQFVSNAWRIVSTTPAAAAAGSPPGGTTGIATSFGPFGAGSAPVTITVADAADASITAQVVLAPQAFIGSRSLGGVTTSFLSAEPLPSQWVATTALSPVITMSNAGGDIWREFRSPVFDLTSAGPVGFVAELVARDTSATSNFEDVDAFRAKLIVTTTGGTSEINLIAPFDTNANGMLNGSPAPYDAAADEFNLKREAITVSLSNTMRLEAVVPANANSVQLVVEAKSIATNEFFDVRKISFSDQCGFAVVASNVTRNLQGQPGNPAAHTVDFTLRANPAGAVSPAGWDVTFNRLGTPVAGANITSGAYSTNVSVTGMPAEGVPITAILKDKADASCFTGVNITVQAPPLEVGTLSAGAITSPVFSSGPATGWTAIATGSQMNAAAAIGDFSTNAVDLSAFSGTVAFSMTLEAEETSTGSNFEDTDTFLAELILFDGTNTTTVNLVTAFDRNVTGQMNGGVTVPAYDPGADDFNTNSEAVAVALKNNFLLTHTIPDNILTATLHIRARADAASEFLRMHNVRWAASSLPGSADRDGDGVTDASETLAGTDPNSSSSVFRVSSLTISGNTVSAGFSTVTGKFYHGYTSTNLTQWTRDDSLAAIPGDGNAAAWPFSPVPVSGTPARYFRVAVGASAGAFPPSQP